MKQEDTHLLCPLKNGLEKQMQLVLLFFCFCILPFSKSGKYGGGTFARSDIAFEFIVFDDNTIDCPTLGLQDYNYIELKPRFELHGHKVDEEGNFYDFKSYAYDVKPKKKI